MRKLLVILMAPLVALLIAGCADDGQEQPLVDPAVSQPAAPAPESGQADLGFAALSNGTVTLDFESLYVAGGGISYIPSYSEDGYTLQALSPYFCVPWSGYPWYLGSVAILNCYGNGETVLTKDDGGSFDLVSIDVSELSTYGLAPRTLVFTGTRPDGSTVSETFVTNSVLDFETFTFSGMTGVESVSWLQVYPYHQFDNIVVQTGIEVGLDIKPDSEENPVNPSAKGVIPVAILGSADFDVADVDATTLAFGPGGAAPKHKAGGHLEDVNGDGYMDLVSHYPAQSTGIQPGDTEACVEGATLNGTALSGCDTIVTVGK